MKSCFALFWTLMCLVASSAVAQQRPNVLMLFIDDLRPQTRDYGNANMQTPNFDRLAAQGVRFESAYCQVPTCGASRASLFTSLYPTRERFPDFLTWAERDAANAKTLPQRFREAGYTTISNGKVFHHKTDTEDRSWSEPAWRPDTDGRTFYNEATRRWMETNTETRANARGKRIKKVPMWEAGEVPAIETHDGKIALKTMQDLERMAAQQQPFFIACGFAKPHMPFYSPKDTYAKYPPGEIELAANRQLPQPPPQGMRPVKEQFAYVPMTLDLSRKIQYNTDQYHRRMRQGYYASVTHADQLMGMILDKLEQLGLDESTYVIVLGDHGWLLGEHNQWAKNTLLHDALRTAWWMTGPGVRRNAAVESCVEFVDIHPTLCELAGIAVDTDRIHGKSFAALLTSPDAPHRSYAYTRFENGDAVSSPQYHYARWQLDDGGTGALLIDRINDPLGKVNQAGNDEYAAVEAELKSQVQAKIAQAEAF